MKKKLLLATHNRHKVKELQDMLRDLKVEVISLEDIPPLPLVEEDGLTFKENAIKKAVLTARASGFISLADDSGLVVDALAGQPGVYSARFAGPEASDQENNAKLLQLMKDIPDHQRTARFTCVMAVSDPQGKVETVAAHCEGSITREPSGNQGFGYDPLFIPEGYGISFAQLSPDEKNRISHRGKALQAARPILKRILG